jgi:hypothetical protein
MARQRTQPSTTEEFKCPECGRTFTRAAALGAHRRQAHGIAGATSRSRAAGRSTGRTAARATSATVALGAASTGAARTFGMGVILLRRPASPIRLAARFQQPIFVPTY